MPPQSGEIRELSRINADVIVDFGDVPNTGSLISVDCESANERSVASFTVGLDGWPGRTSVGEYDLAFTAQAA